MGHARLLLALLAGATPNAIAAVIDRACGAPRMAEIDLAGVPTTLALPGRGSGPWPGILVYPGITARGRMHPGHQGIARGLASAGVVCAVAEPRGLSRGIVSASTRDELVAAATAFGRLDEVRAGGFAVAGVSGGATLALLTAGEESMSAEIRAVLALAPLCDFRLILRAVSTGTVLRDGKPVPFHPAPLIRVVAARSMVSGLRPTGDREALLEHLLAVDDEAPDPYRGLAPWIGPPLDSQARALVDLLVNEDPGRFDELYGALAPSLRDQVRQLSPITVAPRITCPVEVVAPPRDKYVPVDDHRAFVAVCPSARLVVSAALAHVVPRPSREGAVGLIRLERGVARFLARATA